MYQAAIALDIDGTLLPDGCTLNENVMTRLDEINHKCGGNSMFINTARAQSYCKCPDDFTLQLAHKDDHFCWNSNLERSFKNMPVSKVNNMDSILTRINERKEYDIKKECVVIIDDIDINIESIKENGYHGLHVDPEYGITDSTINELESYLKQKCAS